MLVGPLCGLGPDICLMQLWNNMPGAVAHGSVRIDGSPCGEVPPLLWPGYDRP